jgi:PAS domain S-box-containing protein
MDLTRKLLETSPVGFAVHEIVMNGNGEPDGIQFIESNPAFGEIFNLDSNALAGKQAHEVMPGLVSYLDKWIPKISNSVLNEKERVFEEFVIPLEKWLQIKVWPSEENRFGMCVMDITDTLRFKGENGEEEGEFRKIFDSIPHSIFIIDVMPGNNFRVSNFNETQLRFLGMPRGSVQGKLIEEVFPPQVAESIRKNYMECINRDEEFAYEEDVVLPGRGRRAYLTTIVPHKDASGQIYRLVGSAMDVTDRKLAEEKIHQASQKLAFHVENTPLAVVEWDHRFKLIKWSGRAEEIFGWSAEEIIGKAPDEWIFVHEEDERLVDEQMFDLFSGKSPRNLIKNRNYTKDGRVLHCEWYNSVQVDQEGEVVSIFSLVHDISDRVEQQIKLEKSLTEKDLLLAEIHHRVKNNLAIVAGLLQLQAIETEDEEFQQKLNSSVVRVNTMASIHELLYRGESFAELNFSDSIELLVDIISKTLSRTNNIEIHVDKAEARVEADKAIPASLIMNEVLTNVYKHAFIGRDGGKLQISVSENDGKIYISVEDDGAGIDSEKLDQSGSLGVHLIRELTKQLKGSYEYTNLNPGTRFTVEFPK